MLFQTNQTELTQRINELLIMERADEFEFDNESSEQSKQLVRRMLGRNPDSRITVLQIIDLIKINDLQISFS